METSEQGLIGLEIKDCICRLLFSAMNVPLDGTKH